MRILIPIITFGRNGGHRVLSLLADHLIDLGHQVSFICCFLDGTPYFPTNAEIINLSEQSRKDLSRKNMLVNLYYLTKGINKLEQYEYIIANHNLTTFPVWFSRNKARKFYYIQAYESQFYNFRKKTLKNTILYNLASFSYKLKLIQIVNSPKYLDYPNISASEFVPPGIDLSIFNPSTLSKKNDTFKIGCIGRKEKFKGTELVIEAYLELKKSISKEIELEIAFGSNNLAQPEKQIQVCTPSSDKELANFYCSLDLLIAPSALQLGAYHYPIMEAMACGIPVITPGHAPSNETCAWIIRNGNQKDIVKQTQSIINNPGDVDKKVKAGLSIIKEFSWPLIARKFEDCLKTK